MFGPHGRRLWFIRRPQDVVFIRLVYQPAADDRDDAAADQNVRLAVVSGRLSTAVATIGESAAQPIVVRPQALTAVKPCRALFHFQC